MIVCHCNILTSAGIRSAVETLLSDDPHRVITPGAVFFSCGARPQCGACMENVYNHIMSATDALQQRLS
ncbi:MAG: (2Fe-2S)-binding protein [Aestuariivirga sp.]